MQKTRLQLCAFLIAFIFGNFKVQAAQSVSLAWDANTASDIVGYRLYTGTASGVYTQQIEVGNNTSTSVSNLVDGTTYFFAVTDYNTSGVESASSNEVSYTAPTATPTPTPTPTPDQSPTPTPTPTPSPTPTPTPTLTPTPTPPPTPTPTPTPQVTGQFIYAMHVDGTITVHDINSSHSLVKTIRVFSGTGADVRGAAAAMSTARFYAFYNLNSQGHVACVNLSNDSVLWDKVVHTPGVDRGDVTPDGKKLYVPTWEEGNSPYELVVDGNTGNIISTIPMPIGTHDTLCSVDGTKVFMENKDTSDHRVRVISTATDQVIFTTEPFSGKVQPFTVTADNRFLIADVIGTYGFQYADLSTGKVLGTAPFVGTTWSDPGVTHPHGIGMTPDEREAWVCDRGTGNHFVHVFDISTLPPTQTHLITVTNDNSHWLTFTIDGRYCYVAGAKNAGRNTDIVSTATYARVGVIPPSEDLMEVDFAN